MMTPRNKHKMLRERKSVQRTDSLVLLVREEVTMRNGKSEFSDCVRSSSPYYKGTSMVTTTCGRCPR